MFQVTCPPSRRNASMPSSRRVTPRRRLPQGRWGRTSLPRCGQRCRGRASGSEQRCTAHSEQAEIVRPASPYRQPAAPANVQRRPAISIGGIVSRLTRMPRYVVPQIRQTAIHANHASRLSSVSRPASLRRSGLDEVERAPADPGPAVDRHHFPGDEAGLRCGEKGNRVGDFVRPAPSLRRHQAVMRSTAACVFQSCLAAPGDASIGPGATALTRMPWGAHSTASVCVIDKTPAFAAAEWMVPAYRSRHSSRGWKRSIRRACARSCAVRPPASSRRCR